MKWFKHLTIGKKLSLGFLVMLLLMTVIGFAGYKSSKKINHNLEDIFCRRLPAIDYLIEADRDLQQLLVAERSLIFAGNSSDVFKNFIKEYEQNLQQADDRWEKYKKLAVTREEKDIFPKYESVRQEWKALSRMVVDGRIADTRAGRRKALDLTLSSAKDKFEEMRDHLDQLTEINLKLAREAQEEASSTYRKMLISIIATTGTGLLVGVFIIWFIGGGTTRILKILATGLNEGAAQVASASSQVSTASQSLAEGASEQAASIEETSSSLEEMASMTRQNADNATQADTLMKEANQVVGSANASMDELTQSMEEISKASEETSKIIKTIDEIAFQTNLLALNAAVEAARAGEAGAGFAVVADEVRNLAMRAADAAKNTADLIEGTVKKVGAGGELVGRTNEAFGEVAKSTNKVGQLVGEIAAASSEQAQGITQVNAAVNEVDKVTQQNAASAEESASAAEEMNAQAVQMRAYVSDLIALVGGSNNAARSHTKEHSVHSTVKIRQALHLPQKQTPKRTPTASAPQNPAASRDPEKVIPLEKEDFEDF